MVRDGLYYTRDHGWVRVEGDSAVVGITDHAQEQLGDITYIELPEVGARFKQREDLCIIESVKAASDMCSPLVGTVSEVNTALERTPEKINQEPYDGGWICRLTDTDQKGLSALMTPEEYEDYISEDEPEEC